MRRRMLIMIIALIIVFGGIFGWNILRSYFMKKYFANFQPPPVTISAVTAKNSTWTPSISAVGTLAAINGVSVSTEQSGNITDINFESGQMVKQGDLLIQIDDSVDQAQLQSAQATLALAKLSYQRYQKLYTEQAVSEQNRDQIFTNMQTAQASVNQIQATIAQKHITAPFTGKIGIRKVNLGQYVSPGTQLVSLQQMDPLFVNFSIPEQYLGSISLGQAIELEVAGYPKQSFVGKITAINSTVDTQTHNIQLQGTIPNKDNKLYPGLFANIKVMQPTQENVISVPQTAITYSLFGNSVYVIYDDGKDKDGKTIQRVKQVFVSTGAEYKDNIIITDGLKAGEQIVTSGQLKLDNATQVIVNNKVQP